MFITIKAGILSFFAAVFSKCIVVWLHRVNRHLRSCPVTSAVTARGEKRERSRWWRSGGEKRGMREKMR